MSKVTITIEPRAFHTILAALRQWQATSDRRNLPTFDIATNGGNVRPLTDDEIDRLCENLNSR